jgi:hypothetical protein
VPKTLRLAVLLLLAGSVGPVAAFAQAPTQAPPPVIHVYRGLYGPTDVENNLPERLFFTLSTYGAADDSTVFGAGDISDVSLQSRRFYEGAQTRLSFRRQRARSLVNFDTTSALRYYSGLNDATTTQHGGTLAAQFALSPRVKLQMGLAGSYSPYYEFQPGQGTSGPSGSPEQNFSISRQRTLAYGALGSLTVITSRYSELTLDGAGRYTQFIGAPDFLSHTAGGRFTKRVSRDVALVLGYTSGRLGRSDGSSTLTSAIDAGVSYNRGFLLSPKLSFGFSTGSAIVGGLRGQRFELIGSAYLKHQVSGRWTTQLAFARGLQTIDTAPRPFIGETVTGSLSGYLTRRIGIRLAPSYGHGTDVTAGTGSYRSYSNQARIDVAFSRFWAVYVEHFFYNYRMTGGAGISLPPGLDRQGVRTGLVLWAPLVR